MKKHINVVILIVVAVLALAIVAVAYFQLVKENKSFDWKSFSFVSKNQSTETDASDWLTYRNDGYGFEFKYPKEWYDMDDKMMGENQEFFHVFCPLKSFYKDSYYGMASVDAFKLNVIIDGGLNKRYNEDYLKSIEKIGITFNKIEMTKILDDNDFSEKIYLERNNKIIIFEGVYDGTNKEADQKNFYKILSTLKFN